MFFVLLHGIIHLLGFVKAFGLAEVNEFKVEISKLAGIMWLITALLFVSAIVLFFMNKDWNWIPALIAIIFSQVLIILSWQDAKFGTIANVIILIVVIFQFANWSFSNQVEKEIDHLLNSQTIVANDVVTEERLESLPSPIETWLKSAGVVGKEEIHTAIFKQKGRMKLEPDKDWTKAEAEQY